MKSIKYYFILLLSTSSMLLPVIAGFVAYLYMDFPYYIIAAAGGGVVTLMSVKPLQDLRVKARNDVEYDEFGQSKTKGQYAYLSKAERDRIDLQKTADMERVLSSTAIKKMTKNGSVTPQGDMNALTGLYPVKAKMDEMVARMQFDAMDRKKKKENGSMSGRHMVFYGSPGTGKTTVARILTGFLYKYKYIKQNKCVEVDGNFLKAGGDTALKTDLIIRTAYGGVLFIDEAYSLMDSSDGREAIATIIKQMEDNRDRFILILAGYTNEMKMLLSLNPGFESRIKEYLDFPDYNDEEMDEIFSKMARELGFEVAKDAYEKFHERIRKERRLPSFGNARTARNILDETIDRHAYHYMKNMIPADAKYVICAEDISTELKRENF